MKSGMKSFGMALVSLSAIVNVLPVPVGPMQRTFGNGYKREKCQTKKGDEKVVEKKTLKKQDSVGEINSLDPF